MKSFPFEGQTTRCTPASELDLGLQHTLEWLDSGPLNPAQYPCMLLCRPGKSPATRQKKRLQSAGVWELLMYSQTRHTCTKAGTHGDTCRHVLRFTGSRTHPHNQFPSATYSTFTLSLLHQQHWAKNKSEVWNFVRRCCSYGAYFTSTSLILFPLARSMALASAQLDKWSMVNCQVEELKAHHHSTPHSAQGSEGNTSYNVTLKTVQRSSTFPLLFLWANTVRRRAER